MTDARTFIDVLRARAETQSERTALSFLENGETVGAALTYGGLDARAREVAIGLRRTVRSRERVLLLHPPGLEFVTAFFACLYADVVPVPLYPPRNRRHFRRLEAIVADAEPSAVLTQSDAAKSLSAWLEDRAAPLPVIRTDDLRDAASPGGELAASPSADTVAFLQYTSGSTGEPKGVMVTHGSLMATQRMIHQSFGLSEGLVVVSWLPIYHDMGLIGSLMQPLYEGGHCILMSPAAFLQQPRRWLSAISEFRAHTSGGPNFALRLCSKMVRGDQKAGLDLGSLEVLFCGSEPIAPRDLDEFAETFRDVGFKREALYCCYGLAEATLLVTGSTRGAGPIVESLDGVALSEGVARPCAADGSSKARIIAGCGRPAPGVDVAIVDTERTVETPGGGHAYTAVSDGAVGEIWVRGANVAAGYWQKPDLNRAVFDGRIAGPKGSDGPFLRTGDLGFIRDGELFVTGRLKDLIIVRGRNYYPQDIEHATQQCHPAFDANPCAAFSAPVEDEDGLVVVQEVDRHVHADWGSADWGSMVSLIRAAIVEEYDIAPASIVLVRQGSVPRTSSGKVRRHACARAFAEGALTVLYESRHVVPRSSIAEPTDGTAPARSPEEIEAFLVQRLAGGLGIATDDLDVTQPFSAFGLDSAATLALLADAEVWLGRRLPPTLFWDYPTIVTLAAHLGDNLQRATVGDERG